MKLEIAERLAALAVKIASQQHLKPIAIVVLDTDGTVRMAIAQDGAAPSRFAIAEGKACGALKMRIPSRSLAELAVERPTFFVGLSALDRHQGIIPAAGALLIADDTGNLVGCIGISGDTSDNDEECAATAISEAGLSIWTSRHCHVNLK